LGGFAVLPLISTKKSAQFYEQGEVERLVASISPFVRGIVLGIFVARQN